MENEAVLARLPEAYAAAIRLRARGLSDAEIALRLELEPEAVPMLLRLAEAKLAAISRTQGTAEPALDEGEPRAAAMRSSSTEEAGELRQIVVWTPWS